MTRTALRSRTESQAELMIHPLKSNDVSIMAYWSALFILVFFCTIVEVRVVGLLYVWCEPEHWE